MTDMMDRGERLEVGILNLLRVMDLFILGGGVLIRHYLHLVKPSKNIKGYIVKSQSFSNFISLRGNHFSVFFQT